MASRRRAQQCQKAIGRDIRMADAEKIEGHQRKCHGKALKFHGCTAHGRFNRRFQPAFLQVPTALTILQARAAATRLAGGCHASFVLRTALVVWFVLLAPAGPPPPPSSSMSIAPASPWRSASTACRAITGGCRPPGRLHHPARHLSPANDGSALVLEEILQFADAVFDFLPWRLRHPRHLRDFRLGRPASHGCVRLDPANAAILYGLVEREGMGSTTIVVH